MLKRFQPDDKGAVIEYENLSWAIRTPTPTPEPLAVDSEGIWFGTEALVMSALPGRAQLFPDDPDTWVAQLARALAGIHDAGVEGFPGRQAPLWARWEPWIEPPDERMAAITSAIDELRELAPGEPPVFSHGDYHPGNALFEADRLTGVVDWRSARPEPPQHDVAYCRKDLALHPGGDMPDRFLAAYRAETGAELAHLAYWDVLCGARGMQYGHRWVPSFAEVGLPIGAREIMERSTAFVDAALSRLGRRLRQDRAGS